MASLKSKKSTVLVFGTFDLLHPGHVYFLTQAARYGSVVVALTLDELCQYYKGNPALKEFAVRKQRLLQLAPIKEVTPADDQPGHFGVVDRVAPDVVVLGYDQLTLVKALRRRWLSLRTHPRLIELGPYRIHLYQSSRLRRLAVVPNTLAHAI